MKNRLFTLLIAVAAQASLCSSFVPVGAADQAATSPDKRIDDFTLKDIEQFVGISFNIICLSLI